MQQRLSLVENQGSDIEVQKGWLSYFKTPLVSV